MVDQHCVNVSCLVGTLHIASTPACDHGWLTTETTICSPWLTRGRIYLVISKRYCGTMMVLHVQCRPTIKPMLSKRYSTVSDTTLCKLCSGLGIKIN